MTKQAGNTSADREAELRKRLADDAGSFGCPADIADLFAMLDESRAQLDKATRERDSARRTLDRMAEESHTFNAILETTQRDLAEARSQLAALHVAGTSYVQTLGDGEWIALAHALDDAATAAAEHDARGRAPVEAERDHLAHIIDNICGIAASPQIEHVEDAVRRLRDERDTLATALAEMRDHARVHGYAALATAPTTDLAAQREVRVHTDERAKALREAVDAIEADDEVPPTETLERMVREAERGPR